MFDLERFVDTGIVHLPSAFSAEEAASMRAAVWAHLEQDTQFRQGDPDSWPADGKADPSLKAIKGLPVFRPVVTNDALRHVLDHVFGPAGWKPPRQGPRLLLTFPTPGPWTMPTGWHFDASFEPSFPVRWVQLWASIERVDARGGGTLLLSGSHKLVDRYQRELPDVQRPGNGANWDRFMQHHPVLDVLRRGGTPESPGREFLDQPYELDGVAVRTIELAGDPGDMFVSHGHTFHCVSPNTSERPRQMMTGSVHSI